MFQVQSAEVQSRGLTGAIRTSIIWFSLGIKYAWTLHLCPPSKGKLIDLFKELNQYFHEIVQVWIGIHCHWILSHKNTIDNSKNVLFLILIRTVALKEVHDHDHKTLASM